MEDLRFPFIGKYKREVAEASNLSILKAERECVVIKWAINYTKFVVLWDGTVTTQRVPVGFIEKIRDFNPEDEI